MNCIVKNIIISEFMLWKTTCYSTVRLKNSINSIVHANQIPKKNFWRVKLYTNRLSGRSKQRLEFKTCISNYFFKQYDLFGWPLSI